MPEYIVFDYQANYSWEQWITASVACFLQANLQRNGSYNKATVTVFLVTSQLPQEDLLLLLAFKCMVWEQT